MLSFLEGTTQELLDVVRSASYHLTKRGFCEQGLESLSLGLKLVLQLAWWYSRPGPAGESAKAGAAPTHVLPTTGKLLPAARLAVLSELPLEVLENLSKASLQFVSYSTVHHAGIRRAAWTRRRHHPAHPHFFFYG